MIDALRQALQKIYFTIPPQVLDAAFRPWEAGMTLDECIKEKVLLARVRDDISVRGGPIKKIMLQLDWSEYTTSPSPYALGISGSYSTYKIPPEARDHRDISCVLDVRFPYTISNTPTGGVYNNEAIRGNTVSGLACAALQAQTGQNLISSPMGKVRPGNVIQLDPPQYNWVPWQIRVRLRYDDNFSGMDVSTIEPFVELCVCAVKSYIYTQLIFQVETNLVVRGVELGVMKDLVNSYADQEEHYQELLIQLGGAEIFDPDRLKNILQKMVPRR